MEWKVNDIFKRFDKRANITSITIDMTLENEPTKQLHTHCYLIYTTAKTKTWHTGIVPDSLFSIKELPLPRVPLF